MSVRFILGRSGTGKSDYIIQEIRKKLRSNSQGAPIFYIVPEQMTFQQEYTLFQEAHISGSVRAQVVSFSRLAWRTLQEMGGSTKQFISSTGIQMMLRKLIDQRAEQFLMFQKAVDKQGFIQELERTITEFKRHCVTPNMLKEHIYYTAENVSLTNKLNDLHYIYDELMALLHRKYIDGEDQLQLLVEKIYKTPFLQEAEIYLDGFHRFSPKELEIVSELMKVSKQMTFTLTTDIEELESEPSELDLFYQTTNTYDTLKQIAKANDIFIEEPIVLSPENGRLAEQQHLYHL